MLTGFPDSRGGTPAGPSVPRGGLEHCLRGVRPPATVWDAPYLALSLLCSAAASPWTGTQGTRSFLSIISSAAQPVPE